MAKKITSLKPIIVLILGILFPIYIAVSYILYFIYDPPILYLTSTFIQYSCMATAMILITFRKRIPKNISYTIRTASSSWRYETNLPIINYFIKQSITIQNIRRLVQFPIVSFVRCHFMNLTIIIILKIKI